MPMPSRLLGTLPPRSRTHTRGPGSHASPRGPLHPPPGAFLSAHASYRTSRTKEENVRLVRRPRPKVSPQYPEMVWPESAAFGTLVARAGGTANRLNLWPRGRPVDFSRPQPKTPSLMQSAAKMRTQPSSRSEQSRLKATNLVRKNSLLESPYSFFH